MITHQVSQSGFGTQERPPEEIREAILAVEGLMRQLPQVEIRPGHIFADGLYARSILIPKGVTLTGKIHRQGDLQVMVYGDITVMTEAGKKRLQGFNIFPSLPGFKQIGHAHEDTLWVTVHAATETDLDRLEELLFEDEPKVLDFRTGEALPAAVDYYRMLGEMGFTHETAWAQSINEADRQDVDLPGVALGPSAIHGTGVFAARAFAAGERVGLARLQGLRTQLGRFTNHHPEPNGRMVLEDGQIYLEALRLIRAGEEITTDYRNSLAVAGVRRAQ